MVSVGFETGLRGLQKKAIYALIWDLPDSESELASLEIKQRAVIPQSDANRQCIHETRFGPQHSVSL